MCVLHVLHTASCLIFSFTLSAHLPFAMVDVCASSSDCDYFLRVHDFASTPHVASSVKVALAGGSDGFGAIGLARESKIPVECCGFLHFFYENKP